MTAVVSDATMDVQELNHSNNFAQQCIDVRSATEFAAGQIPAAINIPMDEIESRIGDLRLGIPIVLACQSAICRQMLRVCGNCEDKIASAAVA